jgi:hypothetical protein
MSTSVGDPRIPTGNVQAARSGGDRRWRVLKHALNAFGSVVKVLPEVIVSAYESDVARVRAAMGQEAFTAAQEAGRSLSLEEMAAEALALTDELMDVPPR